MLVGGVPAVIRGTITAGTLISSGKIQGNITAIDNVQLLKTAVQIGNVNSPAFSIVEGAYFKGFADMGTTSWIDESSQSSDALPDLTTRHSKSRPQLLERKSGS